MVLKIPVIADGGIMEVERQIQTLPAVAETKIPDRIRLRPNMLGHIQLHVTMEVNAPAGANIVPGAPWNFIKRVQITTPKGDILKNVSGIQMHLLNKMEAGTEEGNNFPASLVAAVSYPLWFDLDIPFYNRTGVPSTLTMRDTALNTNEFTELFITIEFNQYSDLYDNIMTVTNPEVHINILERFPVNTSDQIEPRKKMIDYDEWYDQRNNTELQVIIPENSFIKTIMMTAFDSDFVRFPVTSNVITRIGIEDDGGGHSLRELTGSQVRAENQQYYRTEPGGAGGIWIVEFDQMHDFTSLYDTNKIGYPILTVEFDETLVADLQYFGVFIRQIRMKLGT